MEKNHPDEEQQAQLDAHLNQRMKKEKKSDQL